MGIAQFFSAGFYEKNTSPLGIGSIVWSPAHEISETPTIFNALRATPTDHEVTEFDFGQIGAQHFKAKDILPIKRLSLEDHSELMVFKAKKRPCVVVGVGGVPQSETSSITQRDQANLAKVLSKQVYLVAPMYSCSTARDPGCFGPVMTARIRALKYPHLCYLPPFDAAKASSDPGSIIRLDMTFASYLCRGSEPHEYRVKDEVMDVIQDQLKVVCGMAPSDNFIGLKDLVDDCLVE